MENRFGLELVDASPFVESIEWMLAVVVTESFRKSFYVHLDDARCRQSQSLKAVG
jgi:hypothetical protein